MSVECCFTVAFQLSSVSRFSRDYMKKPESVLEHTGFVAFYATMLAKKLDPVVHKIDYKKLLSSCVLHDIDESLLGDVPRSTKYFNEEIREAFVGVETQALKKLEKWLGVSIFQDWKSAKKDIEGEILKVADVAAVVYKNWVEIELLQNHSFLRVGLETHRYLHSLKANSFPRLYSEIVELRQFMDALVESHKPAALERLFALVDGE